MNDEWPSVLWSGPRNRARTLLGLGVLCCICAWLAILLINVESVLVSGPVLTLVGLATIIYGRRHSYGQVAALGAGHVGICILFVTLVNLLSWGPSQAKVPFAFMGALYILLIAPLSWQVAMTIPRPQTFGICIACGYLLYGLTEPRCPECGREFDPAWLPKLASLSGAAPPADGFTRGDGI